MTQPESQATAEETDPAAKPDHVPPIERMANDLAATRMELDHLKKAHGALVQNVGQRGVCKRCGRDIYWLRIGTEKPALYDMDGASSHYLTCPDRQQQTSNLN